jgi:hypothetical protein
MKRKLDKGKNPISAYRAERNLATPLPTKSLSSGGSGSGSGSDDEGEMYDMSQLQGALPPHSQGYSLDTPQEQERGKWPLAYPQGQSPPRHQQQQQQGGYAHSRSREALVHDRSGSCSRSRSRSRSPSPVFSPDDNIYIPSQSSRSAERRAPPPQSVSFPRSRPNDSENFYANIPLTPKTPLPLLANTDTNTSNSTSHLRPLTPNHLPNHARSHSEERRRELNLTVNTYFDAPPSVADRVGKKFKIGSGKSKIKEVKEVKRKPVSEEHKMLTRMFPGSE